MKTISDKAAKQIIEYAERHKSIKNTTKYIIKNFGRAIKKLSKK